VSCGKESRKGANIIRRAQKILGSLGQAPLSPIETVLELLEGAKMESLAQAENLALKRMLRGYGSMVNLDEEDLEEMVSARSHIMDFDSPLV